jgi:hypothetical protein
MFGFSKLQHCGAWRSAVALVGVVTLGCAAVALASDHPPSSVTIGAPGAELSDEGKPRELPVMPKAPKPPRSLFRCWQAGQMIFEGRGYGPLPTTQVAADLKPTDPASGRIQVLDMNYGLCILELPK